MSSFGKVVQRALTFAACGTIACGGQSRSNPDPGGSGDAGEQADGPPGVTGTPDAGMAMPKQVAVSDFEAGAWEYEAPGLWVVGMGSNAVVEPLPGPPGESMFGLHLVGMAGERGVDVFWHVAMELRSLVDTAEFSAQSKIAGSSLIVASSGSDQSYFQDLEQGSPWLARELPLASEWQDFSVDLDTLEPLGPGVPAPTFNGLWSAVHFILPPNAPYDVWLDDVVFSSDRP